MSLPKPNGQRTISTTQVDQYFKVIDSRQDYLGERYFRFNIHSEKIVQICKGVGEIKKGKSNTFGIYLVHRMTFMANYLSMGYLEPITKARYNKEFKQTILMLI